MRELLLPKQALAKKLRQLLVLFALVLMPVGAWADSYFAINTTNTANNEAQPYWVTDDNYNNIMGDGKMSYDIDNNVLTLNGIDLYFTSDYFSDAFIAMVDQDHPSLTVRLIGSNTITLGDKASVYYGTSITFITDDNNNNASLNIVTENEWTGGLFLDSQTNNPITPTYNSHLFLEPSSANANEYIIHTLPHPELASFPGDNNIMVRFGDETACTDEQTHYSIDYVDESLQDVKNAVWVYNDGDLPLSGPCTMTYYITAGGGQSETMTAKLFGLATNSVTTTLGTPVAPPTIVPAFDHSEDLIITETQTPATGLAPSYDGTSGLISTSSTGETTCSMKVDYYEASSYDYLVLNNMDDYEKYIFGNFTLTVNASTATSYGITVGNTQVTSANAANVLNDDYSSVSYDATTNTLTLKGVHLNSTNNGISVSSDLNINLVGYSNVGTINVTSGTLNFTTSTTLPGCLITDIIGNSTITYGDGTGLSWDGSMVKSSSTNPYIIYATGCKMDGDNYCISGGDFSVKDNKGGEAALDVSTDGTVANSLNNASIDYYKVSSNSKSCYIYPASLIGMNLVTKAYLLFDWGTCTNKDVKVQIKGLDSNYANDGTYSEEVSLPADGGLVEIPLTGTVNSYYFQIYFSSSTGEFSFIPISVGFLKTEGYGLTVAGVEVTPDNASNITGANIQGTVSYDVENHKLTLNGVTLTSPIHWGTDEDLTIELKGTNSITTNGSCITNEHEGMNISFTQGDTSNPCSLTLSSTGAAVAADVISGFGNSDAPTMGAGLHWFSTSSSSATVKTLLSGGEGTEESPLLIKNYNDLKDFATYVNDGTLTTEYVKLSANITGADDFTLIGTNDYPFKGTFDGDGKTISGITYTTDDNQANVGLFAYVGISGAKPTTGTVKNLELKNCSFTGGGDNGAIAGYVNKGTIDNCVVNSCTVTSGNPQSPNSGGIAGTVYNGTISNCVVSGSTAVSANTTYSDAPGTSNAGGVIGNIYTYTTNVVSGCAVEGSVTVNSSHIAAGAIVGGYGTGNVSETPTFTNNTYASTVTTSTKAGTAEAVVKSGQTQRGIGNADDVIGQVELAGTKKVKVEFMSSNGNVRWDAVEGTYYTYTSTNTNYIYYVLPSCNFTFSMKPKNGYKPRFSLSDNAIEVTANEIKEDGAYDHTEFTFTMPSDDLEVIWSYPIDLAADNITATIDNANYTGEAIVPTTVKVKGAPGSANFTRELKKDEDFTITGYKLNGESVDSPVDAGIYTVTIEGIGEYIGTQDVSYEIIKAYALKINGTQLNAKNIDDFYGNGTVKFTPATETEPTNTLTLNGASVTGTIESGLGNLTIKLIGSNTIQGNGSSLITSLNGGTLTFDSDGTMISLLEFKNASGNVFPNDPISGFAEVKYGWVEYVESEGSKKVCSWDIEILKNGTSYRIYDGNKDHILGEGDESVKYSHDATNGHVITLNNAEVNCIWTDIHADITIALNGTNRVIDTGRTYAIYSNNGKINFVKAEGAASAELTATCGNGYVPIEYNSITLGEGLYWKPFYAESTVITDDPEFIIIENYVMTDDRSIETAITYDSTKKILTFNQYAGALTSQIKTGVQGLTIKLKGTSTVAAGSLDYPFKAMTNTASILFDGENDSETGSLVMETNSDSAPFEGFAEGAITYNKVVYSRDDGGNNIHTIKAPTAPTMSLDNEKVKLTKDYDDGTIYYSIAYADDTPSETCVKYTEPFALTHPATITAWVEANNATTSTVTGKHFAYQDAPYTMAVGDTKITRMIPTIEEGDGIEVIESPYIESTEIATLSEGRISAVGIGNTTLSAYLGEIAGATSTIVILNYDSRVTADINVGAKLSDYFEGSNEFCTFYNEDSEIYAVPQGMKAYVVTGVSGSKLVTVETTVLPPNAVVLLEKADGIAFTKVLAEGAAPGGNLLKHATADIPVTSESSIYVLYKDEFVKVTSDTKVPTGKNYLDLSPTANAGTRGFYNILGEDDGSTGIREVKSGEVKGEKWSDAWFDLQGRRLPSKPLKPGLYLQNGKKVVIKEKN